MKFGAKVGSDQIFVRPAGRDYAGHNQLAATSSGCNSQQRLALVTTCKQSRLAFHTYDYLLVATNWLQPGLVTTSWLQAELVATMVATFDSVINHWNFTRSFGKKRFFHDSFLFGCQWYVSKCCAFAKTFEILQVIDMIHVKSDFTVEIDALKLR